MKRPKPVNLFTDHALPEIVQRLLEKLDEENLGCFESKYAAKYLLESVQFLLIFIDFKIKRFNSFFIYILRLYLSTDNHKLCLSIYNKILPIYVTKHNILRTY